MKPRSGIVLALALGINGCASSPPPHIYVLSTPGVPDAATRERGNGRHFLLQPVSLPDYLDTTEIITRLGPSELVSSRTGEWGERLAKGWSDGLRAALAARLPQDSVTLDSSMEDSGGQISVAVEALDVWPDGRCVLAVSWQIEDKNHGAALRSRNETLEIAGVGTAGGGDAVVVAAMVKAIAKLADSIVRGAGPVTRQ